MNKIKIDNYYKPDSQTLRLDEVDYTTTSNSDIKRENEILKENAENNDKVVDKVNWENQLLKKKNQQLQERMEYLERSNDRREDTILEQRQEISDLEDNWDKLKEYLENEIKLYQNDIQNFKKDYKVYSLLINDLRVSKAKIEEVLNKMQEIEGSDSND